MSGSYCFDTDILRPLSGVQSECCCTYFRHASNIIAIKSQKCAFVLDIIHFFEGEFTREIWLGKCRSYFFLYYI